MDKRAPGRPECCFSKIACSVCSLEAVSRSSRFCTFCEHVHEDGIPEHDDGDDADDAMYGLTDGCCKASSVLERTGDGQNVVPLLGSQQQVSDRVHSCVSPPDPSRLPDHVVHTCQSGGEAQRARGGPSSVLDSTPTQEPFERVPSGGEVRRCQDARGRARSPQPGSQEEACPDRVPEGLHRGCPREEDHPSAPCAGIRVDYSEVSTSRIGEAGFRQVRLQDVPGSVQPPQGLLQLDSQNRFRGRLLSLEAQQVRELASGGGAGDSGVRSGAHGGQDGEAGSGSQRSPPTGSCLLPGSREQVECSQGSRQQVERLFDKARADLDLRREGRASGGLGPHQGAGSTETPVGVSDEGARSEGREEPPGDVDFNVMQQEAQCLESCRLQSCHSGP